MGLLGKKVPLYSNLLQGAVIIKTAVVFTPIRYVVFNAELNGTIRILCFRRSIFDLLWTVAQQGPAKPE